MVSKALACFEAQTWPALELVILDDTDDPSFPQPPAGDNVVYEALPNRAVVGTKRNIANALARGEIIVHWDSDDWSDPGRIADQVERLMSSGRAITGYHSMLFYDETTGAAYKFHATPGRYALGTSLCYRKDWWKANTFPEKAVGEDNAFIQPALRGIHKQLITTGAEQLMVARIHRGNTSPKDPRHEQYRPVARELLPPQFLCALTS